jgi:hypothetical protein
MLIVQPVFIGNRMVEMQRFFGVLLCRLPIASFDIYTAGAEDAAIRPADICLFSFGR